MFFRSLLTRAKTWFSRGIFKKYHKDAQAGAVGMWMLGVDKAGLYNDASPHPLHAASVQKYKAAINAAPAPEVIAFGDSLKDIPRDDFQHLKPENNFSISGSRSHHMLMMAEEIQPELKRLKKLSKLRFVHIGTLEGNGFLVGAPLDHAVERATACLNGLRRLFPEQMLIVDLIPPTYSPYANLSRAPYEAAILSWIAHDGNAVSIGFHNMGLTTPNLRLSSDGVHFTPEGIRRFDEAMERARRRSPGTLVEA
ncbi:MAG: hypothetical protein NXI24_17310 [bacterium]|nr:hypothetical protein [bacterium]